MNKYKAVCRDCYLLNNDKTKVYVIGSYRYSMIVDELSKKKKISEIEKKEFFSKTFKMYSSNKAPICISFFDSIRERDPQKILKQIDEIVENKFKDKVLIIYREHPLKKQKKNKIRQV